MTGWVFPVRLFHSRLSAGFKRRTVLPARLHESARLIRYLGWRSSSWRTAMSTSQREQLPPDLVRGRSRFQAWRGQRKPGGRIPRVLWAMATRLAAAHGVSRTAAALGLDYYRLKERAEADASEPRSSGPAFVELTS